MTWNTLGRPRAGPGFFAGEMMSGHDAKCTSHVFVGHGGETVVKGKSRYPDHLILKLPVMDAWAIVNEVTAQLERCSRRPNDSCEISVALLGELTEEEE